MTKPKAFSDLSRRRTVCRDIWVAGEKWFAPGSQPILRGKTPWELMIMIVFRKKSRAKKGNPERVLNNFFQPKKGGSLIAIFKSYHFESFLRWGVNGLSSIQLAKTRPKPTGGFRWSFWSSWTSTRLICHGNLEVCCPQLHFSSIFLTHFPASKIHPQKWRKWRPASRKLAFFAVMNVPLLERVFWGIFGSSRLFFPEFTVVESHNLPTPLPSAALRARML